MLKDILENAFRVLKHDGKVIFTSNIYKDTMTEHIQEFINTDKDLAGKYVVSIINTNDLIFLIGKFNFKDKLKIDNSCVIFTKIDAKLVAKNNNKKGGLRVKKNTKTLKHKNINTQKHKTKKN